MPPRRDAMHLKYDPIAMSELPQSALFSVRCRRPSAAADEAAALKILRGLDVGTGFWNACNHVSPRLPWSGRLGSGGGAGGGATLGLEGIRSFLKPKSLYLRARV